MVQIIDEQVGQNRKKILLMKLAICLLYTLFAALIGLGQVYASNMVTFAGLMAFTAAAALTTYYMVLTQP
jgi:hypothetical protein